MNIIGRNLSTAGNVFALVAYGSITPPFARLMFAAFDDGTIVWSGDRTQGGAPYFTAAIGRDRLLDALAGLESDGLFSELPLVNFGVPGSECSSFIVRKGEKAFKLDACHELFEASGKCVAEHHEIVPLGTGQRFQVLSRQPNDYIFFRMIWLELRRMMENLIPGTEQHCEGQLEMLHAEFRWLPELGEPKR
ncbi:hypothetical protein NZK35_12125 [Stieleria sp. ICT_E10.1]|uniref:hypothetical protein n=1 Tax=Stieleria sedimenti TaxID=2976331 RepID=UPI0021803042|nr:hypothetical protein [Stieleria sedimenti]MCS7467392.1 hypothetical protein [Stieleria sedimenti]